MAVQNNTKQSLAQHWEDYQPSTCAAEIFSRRTFSDQSSKEHDR